MSVEQQCQVDHQAGNINDEEQPLLALAEHQIGGQVVEKGADHGRGQVFLQPDGLAEAGP
jgi:hypothetical protein